MDPGDAGEAGGFAQRLELVRQQGPPVGDLNKVSEVKLCGGGGGEGGITVTLHHRDRGDDRPPAGYGHLSPQFAFPEPGGTVPGPRLMPHFAQPHYPPRGQLHTAFGRHEWFPNGGRPTPHPTDGRRLAPLGAHLSLVQP